MRSIDFYQDHLARVSRSFAFCIPRLEPPLRQWVSLSYLLCRVLDTVEDAPWDNRATQAAQYSLFESFLRQCPSAPEAREWASRFPMDIVEAERLLLADSADLFVDLHAQPDPVRAAIRATLERMYGGMRHYSQRAQDGPLRLANLTDINRYCYFVAGVVGELLSELFRIYRGDFHPGPDFRLNALHFGLFLQKINLLKDQRQDEKEGRYFVPDRDLLLSSLRANARGSVNYLLSLPRDEKGYRVFCAWSLFLGAASLPWMARAFEADDGTKIPRTVTERVLAAVESIAQDNAALELAFQDYLPFLPERRTSPASASNSDGATEWFADLTRGMLARSEMRDLGMI